MLRIRWSIEVKFLFIVIFLAENRDVGPQALVKKSGFVSEFIVRHGFGIEGLVKAASTAASGI